MGRGSHPLAAASARGVLLLRQRSKERGAEGREAVFGIARSGSRDHLILVRKVIDKRRRRKALESRGGLRHYGFLNVGWRRQRRTICVRRSVDYPLEKETYHG